MKNDYSNKNLFVIKYGISAFITILALNANLTVPDNNMDKILDIFTSFRGNRFLDFILFLIIAYFYKTTIIIRNVKFTSSGRKYIYFPAILFSLFMVIGASFKVDNSWQPIWGNISKVIRALIILIGYYYLFIS